MSVRIRLSRGGAKKKTGLPYCRGGSPSPT